MCWDTEDNQGSGREAVLLTLKCFNGLGFRIFQSKRTTPFHGGKGHAASCPNLLSPPPSLPVSSIPTHTTSLPNGAVPRSWPCPARYLATPATCPPFFPLDSPPLCIKARFSNHIWVDSLWRLLSVPATAVTHICHTTYHAPPTWHHGFAATGLPLFAPWRTLCPAQCLVPRKGRRDVCCVGFV